jgi:hypothetical protein
MHKGVSVRDPVDTAQRGFAYFPAQYLHDKIIELVANFLFCMEWST